MTALSPERKAEIMTIRFAIITCSDTRSIEEDTAGAALEELIRQQGWEVASHVVVPDDRAAISESIVEAADIVGANIILTCGGSGLSLRDNTPEATADVCDRMVPGIAEAMRAYSMGITGRAMLSRAVCMQRNDHLVINFPGSLKAARENWAGIYEQFEHAVSMTAGQGH
jgi:molybdopterin adenylyltransferase